ncbi:unnamed protein product [Rangifer tarandus platyrhynchus]|uniref:Uncharacterized protein n=1 Tax=Rangifer tarandus platyrhynchus TaxID=3082113 RepID=A0AC59ZAQ9_RANTA
MLSSAADVLTLTLCPSGVGPAPPALFEFRAPLNPVDPSSIFWSSLQLTVPQTTLCTLSREHLCPLRVPSPVLQPC